MLYLDHAATTMMNPLVLNDLIKSLEIDFANPASTHKLGRDLKVSIDKMREDFVTWLTGKKNGNFYFTSSATESNNTVIFGVELKENDEIIYFESDHKSITLPVEKMALKKIKVISHQLKADGSLNDFCHADPEKIKLVILSLVNNQSGNLYDVNEMAAYYKRHYPKAHIHVDAVQGFAKFQYQFNDDIDSIAITAHKIGGPKGIAGLYLKKGAKVRPLLIGGGQQDDFRASTEAYPLMKAFHLASKLMIENLEENSKHVTYLNTLISDGIKRIIPEAEFPFKNTSPYIICLIVPKISSDILLRHLEVKDVYISSTSACSSKIKGTNPTFKALNIPEKFHKNVLRISLSPSTTDIEALQFIEIFGNVWNEIKYLIK